MTKKQVIIYTVIIIMLIAATGGMWVLIINTLNSANNTSSGAPSANMPETSSNSSVEYSAVKKIEADEMIASGEYNSGSSNENAILVTGEVTADLSGIKVTKTGDSDGGDSASFYGNNSAVLAKSGATLNITNATIETNATGANGVFSYGGSATTTNTASDGTTVNISDSVITTTSDNSGGIMTTGGGVMNAKNLTITTAGISSAAIRSDRGGGTVKVEGGTYQTSGQGSPTIYSTADIAVKDATLVATASEGVVIEGKNSVTLDNVKLTDTNNKLNGQSTTYKNVFLYQSMSGDADTGEAVFMAKNSVITTNQGDSFYVTNTTATINLENNEIINNDASGYFLRVQKDSWGNSGSNGGTVKMNLTNQKADGDIYVDEISGLSLILADGSVYTGAINSENLGEVNVTLDASSKIILTGDTNLTSLTNADSANGNIVKNGHKLFVNGVEI